MKVPSGAVTRTTPFFTPIVVPMAHEILQKTPKLVPRTAAVAVLVLTSKRDRVPDTVLT